MKMKKVIELADYGYSGQFRRDEKTPYIHHVLQICDWLYEMGFTDKKYDEELDKIDFAFYAVALMHDLIGNEKVTEQEILEVSNDYVYHCVEKLTFRESKNPFGRFEYLKEIADSDNEVVLVVKCLDVISNICDMISGKITSLKDKFDQAGIYFHKADVLWNAVYQKRSVRFEKLWKEIETTNNYFKGE